MLTVQRGLALDVKQRLRKKNLLVVAAVVANVYMLNVVLMMAGAGTNVLHSDQEALRLTFHALLVLGVSGLYCTDRNRVWVITAYVYLVHTSLAVVGTAFLANIAHRNPYLNIYFLLQVLANAVLLGAFYRYRLVTDGADDAAPITPTQPQMHRPYVAVCLVYLADLLYAASVIHYESSRIPNGLTWLDWIKSQNESVGTAGHQAVLATIGLFSVIKQLKHACNAYILVAIVSAVTLATECLHLLTADSSANMLKIAALIACVAARLASSALMHLYKEWCNAPERYLHSTALVTEGERLTHLAWRAVDACCYVHALAWYSEGFAMVYLHRKGHIINAATASGVSGAHGAILLGVQLLNSSQLRRNGHSTEKLKRLGFNAVLCIFYCATALNSFACTVWRTDVESNIVTASSCIRALCMCSVLLIVLKLEPCCTLNHLRYEVFCRDEEEALEEQHYAGSIVPIQTKASYCTVAVLSLVMLLIFIVPFYSHSMVLPVALPHTPSDAIAFHFSFLFAIHTFVAIYCHRRISATFVLFGIGYIVPLCVLTGFLIIDQAWSACVLFLLAGSLCGTGYYLYLLSQIYHKYPEDFPGGNIGWK